LIFGSSSSTALSFATSATIAAPAALSLRRSHERRDLPKASSTGTAAAGGAGGGGGSRVQLEKPLMLLTVSQGPLAALPVSAA
jgi:hypothetical protein